MEDCIFCKVVKIELPSYKIYEDDEFFVLLDIFPYSKGHTLIIPKKHYHWVYDVPHFAQYWEVALKITKAIQKALKPVYVSYQTWGLQVPHAHIHIKPYYEETESFISKKPTFSKEEMQSIANAIRAAL